MAGRVFRAVGLVPRIAVVVLMAAVLVDMMLGVFFRYVVGRPLPWSEEVGTLGLIWLTFIGSAVGVTRAAHFAIQVGVDAMGPGAQRACRLLVALLTAAVGVLLFYYGWLLTDENSLSLTPSLGLSLRVQYASAVVGGALIFWYACVLGWSILRAEGVPSEG